MTFPDQLKAHRERLSLTQAELASFLDISPRALWQWEQGKLPHILTQEAALARLSNAAKPSQSIDQWAHNPIQAEPLPMMIICGTKKQAQKMAKKRLKPNPRKK